MTKERPFDLKQALIKRPRPLSYVTEMESKQPTL